ncbi:hypothetical protein HY480_02465 [Candidatus Uhrbacteria bacterium]|nr:hypothetical protein [Candidatus Uhrbacteria bacterium]
MADAGVAMATVARWELPEIPAEPDPFAASVQCACVGDTPILLGAMDEDHILDITRGESALRMPTTPEGLSGAERRAWERERYYRPLAEMGIPRRDGRPGIPSQYLSRCLVEAGEWVPYRERMKLTGKHGSLVPVLIEVTEEFLPFPYDSWALDLRRGERDGRSVWIARAKFPMWGFHATLRYDPNELKPTTVRQLLDIAGFRIGLGSFRKDPRKRYREKRAVFGRFRVVGWEE